MAYYPSDVFYSDEADKLISEFIWAQRRTADFPKVAIAIDCALTMIKYLRDNNFISVQSKDFHITHNKLDSYWNGVERALNQIRL